MIKASITFMERKMRQNYISLNHPRATNPLTPVTPFICLLTLFILIIRLLKISDFALHLAKLELPL